MAEREARTDEGVEEDVDEAEGWSEHLLQSPDMFLFGLDLPARAALFLRMARADYRASAFLDDRALRPDQLAYRMDLDAVLDACEERPPPPRRLQVLVHTGFSCSTLLARCLDEIEGSFVLREPFVLHQLAELRVTHAEAALAPAPHEWPRLLRASARLLSRTYDPGEVAIVKADCLLILDGLLTSADGGAVLFLYPSLDDFLLSVLKLPARRAWARARLAEATAVLRASDDGSTLVDGLTGAGPPETDGEAAAILWVAQMAIFGALRRRFGERRMQTLDAQSFLDDPANTLSRAARLFGLDVAPSAARAIVRGDVMRRHAKDSAQAFDGASRAREMQVLTEALRDELAIARRAAAVLRERAALAALPLDGELS